MKSIWWTKRDLRMNDNQALVEAVANSNEVLPFFVFEPNLAKQADYSPFHFWAWQQALLDLQGRLRKIHSDVLVVKGEVIEVFDWLKKTWDFDKIYSHEETGNGGLI